MKYSMRVSPAELSGREKFAAHTLPVGRFRTIVFLLGIWAACVTPVYAGITVFERQVSQEDDDAEEVAGAVDLGSSDLELTLDGSDNQTVGIRFENIAVPAGEVISRAYIQFTVDETEDAVTTLSIQGEKSADAQPFSEAPNDISARSRTTAAATWIPDAWPTVGLAGLAQQTANLAPVIQEIVSQPSWQSGNAMVLIITGDGEGERTAQSFDLNPAGAPILHIEYGATLGNQVPIVSAGSDRSLVLSDVTDFCALPANTICVEGSVSDDGATPELQTQWIQTGGPSGVTAATPDAASTSLTFDESGIYNWLLQADDGELTGFDDVIVTVGRTINVPGDAATIQEGVDLAQDGDLVLVAPGIYQEIVLIEDKTITLASHYYLDRDPAMIDATVIDGGGIIDPDSLEYIVRFASSVGRDSTIMGFHIRNGNDGVQGFAPFNALYNHISETRDALEYKSGSGGLARGNLLENNIDDGIDLNRDTILIAERNIMRDNNGDGVEMRMYPYEGPVLITIFRDNIMMNNENDGIQLIDYDGYSDRLIQIENNLFLNNEQAGVGIMGNGVTNENYEGYGALEAVFVTNNTFIGNDHGLTGGANLQAYNNIFLGQINIALKNTRDDSATGYNLFWNNGTDIVDSNVDPDTNVFADPLLDSNAYPLAGSPAIDAGIDAGFPFNGAAPDLGAYETPVNSAPSVDAGADIVRSGAVLPVSLAGVVQDDGLPDAPSQLSVAWEQVGGACGVEFVDSTAAATEVLFPEAGYYRLKLTADDGLETVSDEISVCIESDGCHP